MKIQEVKIPVREIVEGYKDSADEGVVGYGGRLDIRPAFQREFIYKEKQREEVIRTVLKGFPLNSMYWTIGEGGGYELLDGQQRTISLCQYVNSEFAIDHLYFQNLSPEEKAAILDYELQIYICEGTQKERQQWFEVINIAGMELTKQEIRNAIYVGPWLTEAKKFFSKPNSPALKTAKLYLRGAAKRQDYLETVLRWITARDGEQIEDYMAKHQFDTNCNELWLYYNSVVNWVSTIFPKHRSLMAGLDWGIFYNRHGQRGDLDPAALEKRIAKLLKDDDVSKKSGIYAYLLDGNEKHLSLRAFTESMREAVYEEQGGKCPSCGGKFPLEKLEADHIIPWSRGGKTEKSNCQLLCQKCHDLKTGKQTLGKKKS